MNWVQKNPFLTAFLGGTLVVAAGAAYFSFSSFTKFEEATAQYDAAVSRLHGLQNKTPFPSEENLKKFAVLTDAYEAKFDELLRVIAKRQMPLEATTPQAFQDNLRAQVSSTIEQAKQNNVQLPEGFYLGFDQYRDTPPSDAAAPILAAQLTGVQSIVNNLIELKVNAITALTRVPLPIEEGGAARPAPAAPNAGNRNNNPQNAPKETVEPLMVTSPIELSFLAEQGKVRQALNGIVTSERFLIIRSLTIQNTQLQGPPRQSESVATPAPDPNENAFAALLGNTGDTAGATKNSLSVVVGRELVNVNTRIEMVGFNLPEKKD